MIQPSTSSGRSFMRAASLSTIAAICCWAGRRGVAAGGIGPAAGDTVRRRGAAAPATSAGEPVAR